MGRKVTKVSRKHTERVDDKRRVLPRFTHRLSLGAGLVVSPFCLGMTDNWRLIPAAFEMGINFFFITTDLHWPRYEASRKGVRALLASRKGIRDEIAIAGACYVAQPEFSIAPFRELVDAVPGMLRVDVLVAGGVHGPDLLARATLLRELSANTHARAVGASFHSRQAGLAAANHNVVDLCFVRYNPVHPGARYDLLPQLRAPHPPLFNFTSMRGFVPHDRLRALNVDAAWWYPDAPDYYRYALSQPEMAGLLFSISRPRELVELEMALTKGGLTREEEDHLEELAFLTQNLTRGHDDLRKRHIIGS